MGDGPSSQGSWVSRASLSAPVLSMASLRPGDQIGHYRIEELVARSGMASIYRAFKPGSKETFVVKVLLPEFSEDEQFRKRFEREVGLLQT